MSTTQNVAYAVVQIAHNFGAVAAVGGSLAAAVVSHSRARRDFVWLAFAGWGIQGASGATFGAVSYYFYHRFPDISGLATDALVVKIACVIAGAALLGAYLAWEARWASETRDRVCMTSAILAITALSAAAFLRWFS